MNQYLKLIQKKATRLRATYIIIANNNRRKDENKINSVFYF